MKKSYIIITLVTVVLVGAAVFAFTYTQLSSQNGQQAATNPIVTTDTASNITSPSGQEETTVPTSFIPTINMEQGGSVSAGITLLVSQPQNGQTFTSSSLVVKGKTKAKADIFVNEKETKSDASGNFSVTVTLEEGDNPIVVVVVDPDGNYAENELSVNYQPKE